jgi:hypothetical protein
MADAMREVYNHIEKSKKDENSYKGDITKDIGKINLEISKLKDL